MQYKNLGKYIRNKRIKAGISLNNFAIQNDIELTVLSHIENEKEDIKFNLIKNLKFKTLLPATISLLKNKQTALLK